MKNANTSITYGTQSNFTAVLSNDFVRVYVNGTQVEPYTKNEATYLKDLAAGLYKVTANTNVSGVANVTYYEKINKTTPTLSITDIPGNFTYNGTKDNSSAVITTINSQLSASLYINGKLSSSTTSRASYLNASAGTYAAVFNTSGNVNYTAASVKVTSTISKAALSQTLKAFPSNSFTYDGQAPTIQDTLNASILPGNSLSFDLVNDSLTAVSTSSSSTPFNFTALAGKYAAAGSYSYTSTSGGNSNYTVTGSPAYAVTISQATPALTLTSTPTANYTQNGTSLVFHFSVTSINSQLDGSFYINGSLKNSSLISGTYNAGSLPNIFLGKFNTSGNQNYTSYSISRKEIISVIVPLKLLINGLSQNSTIIYGTLSNFTAIASNSFISLYLNNTLVSNLSKNTITYLKVLPAGYWKITASLNSSSSKVIFYQYITKAVPKLSLTVTPGNFVYNGNPDEFIGDISTVNNQLSASLHINNLTLSTYNSLSYFESSAGIYNAEFITAGNQNYTSFKVTANAHILKAVPSLYLSVPNNFVYNGKPGITNYSISSVNNQLHAEITLNGSYLANISNLEGQNAEINPGTYVFRIFTLGNQNYTPADLIKSYTIFKLKTVSFNFSINSFNNSLLKTKGNESQISSNTFLIRIERALPGILDINLTHAIANFVGIDNISFVTNLNIVNQSITITKLANLSCFGEQLNTPINFFNTSFSFNDSNPSITTIYYFEINKSKLNALSLTAQNISLYRCSNKGWEKLPTYLIAQTNGAYYYKGYSDSPFSYAIAKGFSYTLENTPQLTNEFINETGLPKGYVWNATYDNLNETQVSGMEMIFLVPSGNYPAVFYKLSNGSYNNSHACTTVYYPTNVKANMPIVIPAGLFFTVNYANYTKCALIHVAVPSITYTQSFVFILLGVFLLTIIALILIFLYYIKKLSSHLNKAGRRISLKMKRRR